MFVTQRIRCAPDQIEESIATRFDVRAVLDIVRRPILLSGGVVPLVKQCVEGVEYQRLIFLLCCLTHNNFLILSLCDCSLPIRAHPESLSWKGRFFRRSAVRRRTRGNRNRPSSRAFVPRECGDRSASLKLLKKGFAHRTAVRRWAVVVLRLRYVLCNRDSVFADDAHTVRKLLRFVKAH